MTEFYWVDYEVSAWSSLWLGGERVPGIVAVDVTESRDVDVKKAAGSDKAPTADNGGQPSDVKIEIVLPTRGDWVTWQKMRASIAPTKPGGGTGPINISHPETDLAGVSRIMVKSLQTTSPTAKDGMKITIQSVEYVEKPKPVTTRKAVPKEQMGPVSLGELATAAGNVTGIIPAAETASNLFGSAADAVTGWFS